METTTIQHVWRTHAEPFTAVVDDVRDWDAPSPCEGWSARDVLDHVVETERDFLARQGLSLPDLPGGDPAAGWREHAAAVDALLGDDAVANTTFEGAFGPTTVGETLARYYGFDLLVHRWDLARSQGRDEQLSAAELATIDASVDGFGEHAYAPGIFAAAVDVPADADAQRRVLARTGRTA